MSSETHDRPQRTIGRYALFGELASGGMATVHLGRMLGAVGFARTVAIKRLHPHFAKDPEFVAMFVDEARLAARIRHPNVVPTLDVVSLEGELFLIMEYVDGESLASLLRGSQSKHESPPVGVAVAVLLGVLHGLHAAHEATSERGEPLNIVHRDVSPQNILVGVDGVPRVLDFGVAKAAWRLQTTQEGQLKGKLAYMAPEQLERSDVDRRLDVYAASVVLWEALTGRRLFRGDNPNILGQIANLVVSPPSQIVPGISTELDRVVLRGVSRDVGARFPTAHDMAVALERAGPAASQREVGEWVRSLAATSLRERAGRVAEIESMSSSDLMGEVVTSLKHARPTVASSPGGSPAHTVAPPFTDPSMSVSRQSVGGRRTVLLAAVAGTALVGVLAIGARSLVRDSAMVPSPSGAPPPTAPELAQPVPTPTPDVEPSASSSAPTVASAPPTRRSAPGRPSRPPGGGRLAPAQTQRAPGPTCNPYYTVDANGIKHPKPECL